MNRLTTLVVLCTVLLTFFACKRTDPHALRADSTSAVRKDSAVVPLPSNIQRTAGVVRLALNLKKGDHFSFSIGTRETVTLTRDTITEHSKQEIVYRYRFDVVSVGKDSSATLQATCIGVTFHGDYSDPQSHKTMTYDSDNKNDAAKERIYAQYNAPLHSPFRVLVSNEGRVESAECTEAVLQRLMGKDYNSTKQAARELIRKDYAESGLKNVIQLAFQKLENRSVGVDSSWTVTWAGKLGFLQLENVARYTLKGFTPSTDGTLAHIAVQLVSRYVGNKKMDTGQGMATIETFNVNGNGVTVFNLDHGRPMSRALKQRILAKFFIEPPEELKKAAPGQVKDFWMTQDATVENTITSIDD